MKQRVVVLGGGSWGATLGDHLARVGHDVCVWEFLPEMAEKLQKTRSLDVMPHLRLHPAVRVTSGMAEALRERPVVVSALTSAHVRATFHEIKEKNLLPENAWVVSATKGIENDTTKRMSEIITEEIPALENRVAALSGPSHAEEVSMDIPTAVVSAGPAVLCGSVQKLFNSDTFRVYTSPDMLGVELGGALKNIYAIACGACDGLGLGDNTKAALMTRGLNEMCRLGIVLGAKLNTFFGLSGVGDMIVTCTSRHSRNRLLGEKVGQGKTPAQALAEMTMVAEGMPTTKSAWQLGRKHSLELPIVNEIHRCLYENKTARRSLQDLMTRPVSDEMKSIETLFKEHCHE